MDTLVGQFKSVILPAIKIPLFVGCGAVIILVTVLFFVIRRIVKRKRKEREILALIKRLVGQSDDIYYIIDIRDNKRFQKGHLPTSINVPYKNIDQFFPTEMMFSQIIICGDKISDIKRAARDLSDRAYFRVETLCKFSRWDGEWETGEGISKENIEGECKNEVQ